MSDIVFYVAASRKNSAASNLNSAASNLNLVARSFCEMPCSFLRKLKKLFCNQFAVRFSSVYSQISVTLRGYYPQTLSNGRTN